MTENDRTDHHYPMDRSRHRAVSAYNKIQGLLKQSDGATPQKVMRPKAGDAPPPTQRRSADASDRPISPPEPDRGERSVTEVARYLALIGRAEAAEILKHLPDEQVKQILEEMTNLSPISRREAMRVLSTFDASMRSGTHPVGFTNNVQVGPETAREILIRAFGEDAGERRFYEILPNERPARFAFLNDAEGHQLSYLVKDESVATLAIICSNMPRPAAARLLAALDGERKTAVLRRIASIDTVAPEALQAIEGTLRKKLESIQRPEGDTIDGEAQLAEILRYMDLSTTDQILHGLKDEEPDLEEHIRNRLSSPEDLLYVADRDVQRLLQRVDDVDLATIIKGKDEDLVGKLLGNLSERRREMVEMHRETLGPMRRKDVDTVTKDFMVLVRELAKAGEIVLRLPGKDTWVE